MSAGVWLQRGSALRKDAAAPPAKAVSGFCASAPWVRFISSAYVHIIHHSLALWAAAVLDASAGQKGVVDESFYFPYYSELY